MFDTSRSESTHPESGTALDGRTAAPAISLPKGGGAIRGMGEKFAANPVTGAGSLSIPLATSPGRAGFGPRLSLSYDSGAGAGPFGLGWRLALPSISRKTDKGIPRYNDAQASDEFILSGAEDLVPVLVEDGQGNWGREIVEARKVDGKAYEIKRYRPRIEGLFARIELWRNRADAADTFWRSISKDNITTWYGRTDASRIFDPADAGRIFTWLISESHDDKGNDIVYGYCSEDSAGVDPAKAHEKNRTDQSRSANRYLKRIRYGNHRPYYLKLVETEAWPTPPDAAADDGSNQWFFEVVFDFGEHDLKDPKPTDADQWPCRPDPFSTYRAGFEIRTYRLCRRVLMFHHFANEADVGTNCLVRSTDFSYGHEQQPNDPRSPIHSLLQAVTQRGYKRREGQTYMSRSLPPLEFEYSRAEIQQRVEAVEAQSLENLPRGLDNGRYQWVDLDGEGISGILTEQGEGWFYKRNLSPINRYVIDDHVVTRARFGALETVAPIPSPADLTDPGQQLLDLAGDGQLDLVELERPAPGFYERSRDEGWEPFKAFRSRPNLNWQNPNLKFVDLNGDGHADILISEERVFSWHPSLAEAGFGPAERIAQAADEEQGPRLVFADGTQSIYLADLSGDGLSDIARIRNGEVCYWPNLGYGHFGAKVTMDDAPWFDVPDLFNQQRIRLADIDGSGTTDILYLTGGGLHIYFNHSGNGWSQRHRVHGLGPIHNLASVTVTDLLGNGTACLVWSSPLPGRQRRCMRYIDLMGGSKPHLLVKSVNNLGAETRVHYAPSTRFYLADQAAGRPWISKIPFPVLVVERVETCDRISRNRFVTRYSYHHGCFDGIEREFRGFGRVDQWDTEEIASLTGPSTFPTANNMDPASQVPPVLTKTWFHTGVYLDRDHISRQFEKEYYREPGLSESEFQKLLLPDTILPSGLDPAEEQEACRALKGTMLRQEIYALDGTEQSQVPYTVVEQNFGVRPLQPGEDNRHAVFLTHPHEVVTYHYERNPVDPRIQHALTLEVDDFGNALKEAAIGYGRRRPDAGLPRQVDRDKQARTLITYTENRFTNPIDHSAVYPDDHRSPLLCETRTYELTGLQPENHADRFIFQEWTRSNFALAGSASDISYEQTAGHTTPQKRLIEHVRTVYRKEDFTALFPLGEVGPLAVVGESYKLAFDAGLLTQGFQRDGQSLLPNPAAILDGTGMDQGGYQVSQDLKAAGVFPSTDPADQWWIPSGRVFFSPEKNTAPAQERFHAESHFFLAYRTRDPFLAESVIIYDTYNLLMLDSEDALGNRVTVGERLPNGELDPAKPGNDYRVLQPWRVMDPNRNRSQVAFDTLGMVVGTAVMGKPEESQGDSLDNFTADWNEAEVLNHLANPLSDPHAILGRASTRLIYDLFAFQRSKDQSDPQPAAVHTLVRETHDAHLNPGEQSKIQHRFSYSDGFGREIQQKIQAEPQEIDRVPGPPRWVGSGWTVFNNKGNPVRQYEPFFSATHRFEFGIQVGVSPVLFYDPIGRLIATLSPNDTYAKAVFGPWQQRTWDPNDTVLNDPRTDPDIAGYVQAYFKAQPSTWKSWYEQRHHGALGASEQAAAEKAAIHADTPITAHFDTLGRHILTVAHNKFKTGNTAPNDPPTEEFYHARVNLDIEGNQREIIDAGDRITMRYDYDMLGNRIVQYSMETGTRWMLNSATGSPIRSWNSRGHTFRTEYDPLRRPLRILVSGADPNHPNQELLTERFVYGEQHPEDEQRNLRGALCLRFDQSGLATTDANDFKGNALQASRRLAVDYRHSLDWKALETALPPTATAKLDPAAFEAALVPLLEAETYVSKTAYDALNRPVTQTTPHTATMPPSVLQPVYNEANLLQRVDVNLRGAQDNGQPVWTPFVTNIDYDAKGQRQRIDYGNGVSTVYQYDPQTFRLARLLTRRRAAVFPQDCPQPPPMDWPGCEVQNLHYHYDPVGNISRIRDEAQQTVFFLNRRVEPSADYTHDATYRLIEATGREHLGQIQGAPIPHSHDDRSRMGLYHPSDGNAMGTYTERYGYDAAGNLVRMLHSGSSPNHLGWTRNYDYHEPSLIEPQKVNNRLSVTTVGTNNPITERWVHDLHGSMIRMPHLGGTHPAPNLHWDHRDQLRRADLGGGGTVDYTYDITGQRVRKVWQKSSNLIEERIYFSGFEIYRRRQGAELLERETLHIHDDQQRIALVETRTVDTAGTDSAPPQLIRYQFGNHLGSASLELDDQAQLISYEEYTPYGSTSYQAVRSQTETPKRYRFTGKERDEETGLFYHGARYYAPWLGRWTAADPMGLSDGNNVFAYVRNRPINLTDPTGTDGEAVSTRESPMSFNNWEYFAEANAHRFQSYEHARVAWYQARGLDPYKSACMPPDPEPPPPPPPPPQAAHPSPAPKQKQIGLPFQHVRNEVLIPVESFPDTGNWAGNTFHWTMGYTYNSMAFLVNSGLATLDQADKIKRSMLKSIGFSSYDIQAMDDTLLVTSMTSRGPLVIRNGVAGGIIFLQAQAAQSKREAQAARRVISFLGSYGMAGMPIVSPGKVSADKFARRAQGLDDAATMKVGLNKGAKEADKVKVVAKVEIEGQEFYGSNAFSSNQNNPFMDLNARPGHAEIDALGQAAGSVNTTGRSAEMWVTESLCSGACLGSKFGGNVPKAMQQMGLEKLTIHTPTESFVLTPQGVIFHRVY